MKFEHHKLDVPIWVATWHGYRRRKVGVTVALGFHTLTLTWGPR